VEFLGSVDRQPDEHVVLLEEGRPVLVEQHAVGLDRVVNAVVGLLELLDEFHRTTEEVEPQHRGLAARPGHCHIRGQMRLEQLA